MEEDEEPTNGALRAASGAIPNPSDKGQPTKFDGAPYGRNLARSAPIMFRSCKALRDLTTAATYAFAEGSEGERAAAAQTWKDRFR